MKKSTNGSASFSSKTKAEEVGERFLSECVGKTILITGANCGLGLETARVLASKGSQVILACRNPDLAKEGIRKIKEECPDADVHSLHLDLGDLKSVKESAIEYESRFQKLNILINNAGIMACPKSTTKDGVESQFGVNHLGHFYLTNLLLPVLSKSGTKETPSRVVNLSSMAQFVFAPKDGILFDDINGDKHYHDWQRYGHSKLANVLFSNELNDRCKDKRVISIAVHPGVITSTNLMRHKSIGYLMRMLGTAFKTKGGVSMAMSERQKSIAEGASTTLVAALDPAVKPGGYYVDCQETNGKQLHSKATDKETATKLWDLSDKMCAEIVR